jgi:hypothetical protein
MFKIKKRGCINISFLLVACVFCSSFIQADVKGLDAASVKVPRVNSVSIVTPKQIVKELTVSHYIFIVTNDFDRDGEEEIIVGANCKEGFCDNYIFKVLTNNRYQYLGFAQFHHETYELIWPRDKVMPDILFFKQENVGQGCIGRLKYKDDGFYKLDKKVCRLPKITSELLGSYAKPKKEMPALEIKRDDPDVIDFSDLEFDDSPEDFFPDGNVEVK